MLAKWKEGIEGAESPQNKVRTRIVRFLGSLGGQVNSSLVETESAAAYAAKAVSWDTKNRLEFPLPFQDMKPSLFLGRSVFLGVGLLAFSWALLCEMCFLVSCECIYHLFSLDPFLPRICELATSSSDRQTKVEECCSN